MYITKGFLEVAAAYGQINQHLVKIDSTICAKDNMESAQDPHPMVTDFVVRVRDGGPDCGATPFCPGHVGKTWSIIWWMWAGCRVWAGLSEFAEAIGATWKNWSGTQITYSAWALLSYITEPYLRYRRRQRVYPVKVVLILDHYGRGHV